MSQEVHMRLDRRAISVKAEILIWIVAMLNGVLINVVVETALSGDMKGYLISISKHVQAEVGPLHRKKRGSALDKGQYLHIQFE